MNIEAFGSNGAQPRAKDIKKQQRQPLESGGRLTGKRPPPACRIPHREWLEQCWQNRALDKTTRRLDKNV